jgi:hypothetical protein
LLKPKAFSVLPASFSCLKAVAAVLAYQTQAAALNNKGNIFKALPVLSAVLIT